MQVTCNECRNPAVAIIRNHHGRYFAKCTLHIVMLLVSAVSIGIDKKWSYVMLDWDTTE